MTNFPRAVAAWQHIEVELWELGQIKEGEHITAHLQNVAPLLEAADSYAERQDDWDVLTQKDKTEEIAQLLFDLALNEKIKATNNLLAAALAYAKWGKGMK